MISRVQLTTMPPYQQSQGELVFWLVPLASRSSLRTNKKYEVPLPGEISLETTLSGSI